MEEDKEVMEENEEVQEKMTIKQVSTKWGLYLGMLLIIYGMILLLADLSDNQPLGYVSYLFIAGFIYLAHKAFIDQGSGFMTYGEGLKIGVLVTVVSSAISNLFSYLYVTFVDDSILDKIIETAEQGMVDQGLSDAEIDQAMSITEKVLTPVIMFPLAFVVTVFFGFIIALIVSAITKKPDPSLEI